MINFGVLEYQKYVFITNIPSKKKKSYLNTNKNGGANFVLSTLSSQDSYGIRANAKTVLKFLVFCHFDSYDTNRVQKLSVGGGV